MRKSALYLLGFVVFLLVAVGLVVLSSASEVKSIRLCGRPWYFVSRQFAFIAAGVALAVVTALVDYHRWKNHPWLSIVLGGVIFVLLWAVFLFPETKGSHRWIPLPGGISVQPGELSKLATVLLVAVCIDKAGWRVELFRRGALYPASLIAFFAVPVMLEPDFGSVMVIGFVGFMLMFMGGTRILHMLPIAAAGGAVVLWKIFHNANRMARLASFVGAADGASGADSAAYQGDMSVVAIHRGGLFGVGLGRSMQKQNYLPEAWTDFIFAVGAEELGLVFSVGVIVLFLAFFALSIYIACKASDRFGKLLVMGMSVVIFFQAMFNIGVVCEAFPTKGMALPFFSYGGTNMVTTFIAVGVIFSVGLQSLKDQGKQRTFNRRTAKK